MVSERRSGDVAGSLPNPTVSIRSILPALAPAERRVAEQVLARPTEVSARSIGDLATASATSEATVVRFCKKAGFAGYPDLRLALASEAGRFTAESRARVMGMDIGPDDSLAEVVAKVGALDAEAVTDTVNQINVDELAKVVEAVARAPRIELYGIGASGLVAVDLEQKLRRIGLSAAASIDGHAALTSAAVLAAGDVAIGISHTGETLDVVDPIQLAGSLGATTVAITNHPRSSLAGVADLVLTTAAREAVFRAGAMASRSAQLTIVDCLYLGVAHGDYANALLALERTSAAVRSRRQAKSVQQ